MTALEILVNTAVSDEMKRMKYALDEGIKSAARAHELMRTASESDVRCYFNPDVLKLMALAMLDIEEMMLDAANTTVLSGERELEIAGELLTLTRDNIEERRRSLGGSDGP